MTDAARDKYLQRKYGITLQDYKQMAAKTNNTCWICGKLPKEGKNLHVDHDHTFDRAKVTTKKVMSNRWQAQLTVHSTTYVSYLPTRNLAIKSVRKMAKKASVRGLLCWRDNSALQKFRDNPELLEAAAKYLRSYKERLNATNG